MTAGTQFTFEHTGIGHALADKRLAVPLNQREYSWEEEHISELFSDLHDAEASEAPEYFLGTIVLTRGPQGQLEVSDGQQRLATTSIFLAAIRDYFLTTDKKVRADGIQSQYLFTTDLRTEETVPRLKLNVADDDYYRNAILSLPGSPQRNIKPTKPSHEKILHAAKLAAAQVATIVAGHKPDAQANRLIDWVNFVAERARVILAMVPEHMDAFTMFETLNDRGLHAAQSDLLKNYLFSRAGDRMPEVQHRWAAMGGILESVARDPDTMTVMYLRHFVITKNGPTRERELFAKVKNTVKNKQSAVGFADELAENATHYSALLNPQHETWNPYGTTTRKHVETLIMLRVEQIRPLLLAITRKFEAKEVIKAFRLFVSWTVRFLVVGGGRGGFLDKHYGTRAQQVGADEIKTASELAKAMGANVPTDAAFEAAFSTARVTNAYLARYYLRALERRNKGLENPEFLPSDEEEEVNLEHVLPQNPGAAWTIDADLASALYKRIGNMALLKATSNLAIANLGFPDKAAEFKKSPFTLTAEIASYNGWGPAEIEDRQKKMAKLAVETWPLTP